MSTTPRTVRRGLAAVLAFSATAALLAGCAGGPSSSDASDDTITFMNWEPLEGSSLQTALTNFTKDTGIKIEYQFSASGSDYWPKTRTVLGSKNPPDIMRIDDDFLPYYASTGKLLDLTDYVTESGLKESDYYDAVWNDTVQEDGKIVGWSLGIQPRVLFYNKDMFTEAGVPLPPTTWSDENWKWDDFVDAAQKLSVKNERWGASIVDDSGYENIFGKNNGGDGRWTADGKGFGLSTPEGMEAVQFVADLTCTYDAQPSWSELQQNNKGVEMFAAGQIGMIERASGFVQYFRENVKDFEWDVAPIPGEKEQLTQGNQVVFAIPTEAAHKDAAWKLLEYLTTKPGADVFASEGSQIPGYKPSAELAGEVKAGELPAHLPIVLEAADNAFVTTRVANIEEAIGVYRPALDPIKNCQAQAVDVLPDIEKQVLAVINP